MSEDSRAEKLLALLLLRQMSDATDQERMVTLSSAGFSNSEIAELTGKSSDTVKQQLYLARSKRSKKKAGKARKPKKR